MQFQLLIKSGKEPSGYVDCTHDVIVRDELMHQVILGKFVMKQFYISIKVSLYRILIKSVEILAANIT